MDDQARSKRLIFGCGYLGIRVARRWIESGGHVWAVTRSPDRADLLRRQGIEPIVWNLTSDTTVTLPEISTVLFAVGFDRAAGKSIREVYVGGLRRALDRLPSSVRRFIYVSSTGVYSQDDGQWVDELSPCRPRREGGHACLEAEQLLAGHSIGERAVVLRLAGLYGPGRIPRRADLESGRPIDAPASGYLNLIHVEDAAEVVLAAESHTSPERLYTVSDGHPPLRSEYYAELARIIGAPPPRFTAPPDDSPASRRAASDKRVANGRMLELLPRGLQFPSYREGLADAVERATSDS